jgi:putative two-component system response regulator
MDKPVINAQTARDDIRAGLDDAALMKKYNISYKGLQSLLEKLVSAGVVSQKEVDERRFQRDESVIIDLSEASLEEPESEVMTAEATLLESALVISDDTGLLALLEGLLDANDFHVVKSEDALPSADTVEKSGAVLVVADLATSGMNAAELVRRVQGTNLSAPLIVVANDANRDKALDAMEDGAFDAVFKPLDSRTVMSAIRRARDYGILLDFKRNHMWAVEEEVQEKTMQIVRTKDFFNGILDSSTLVSVVLTDMDQRVVFWNTGAENIFGYTAEEMIGERITKLYPPDALTYDTVENLRKVMETKSGTAHGKMKQVSKDGRLLTISLAVSPMVDPHTKEAVGIVGIGIDVTEEVRQQKEIFGLLHQVRRTQDASILALARLAQSRGFGDDSRLARMQDSCRALCQALEQNGSFKNSLTKRFSDDLVRCCVLYDIGMVSIPDSILWAPSKLHPKEQEILKEHVLVGGRALEEAVNSLGEDSFLSMGKDVAYYHHEHWDGSGYPLGLKDEDIPLAARIVGLMDYYDMLVTGRDAKTSMSHDQACREIDELKGSWFDPNLVETFLEIKDQIQALRLPARQG